MTSLSWTIRSSVKFSTERWQDDLDSVTRVTGTLAVVIAMGNILPTAYGLEVALWILVLNPQVAAWNDHYDKEDDAWVMKIFFPIIAALILLCVGSCGYANYCKKPPTGTEEEDEVDRSEDVYTLNKPDRPYLTPHYQRRTFQPPPPAYDNHAFRPTQPQLGPKPVSQPSSIYQRHQPQGLAANSFVNSYQHYQPQGAYNQNTIKPPVNPMRSYSFQSPQNNNHYAYSEAGDRSKSLWDVQQNQTKEPKPDNSYNTGRASPIQSTRSAPAEYPGQTNLRRTYSSPNLTPSGSNGSFNQFTNQYQGNNQNQFSNQFGNHRHSMNYGRNNPYQRTPSPASSNSTYIPAASEVGSTAPLFGRRRSPAQVSQNVYEVHNPVTSRSQYGGSQYGGSQYGASAQEYNQPRRPYEMEDIYGGSRGNGMSRYGFQHQQNAQQSNPRGMPDVQFTNNYPTTQPLTTQTFSNSYTPSSQLRPDQQPTVAPSHQFQNNQFANTGYQQFGQPVSQQPQQFNQAQYTQQFNQQQSQQQNYQQQQQQSNSLYEHLQPRQQDNVDNYNMHGGNMAYDPYNDPYNGHNSTLPGV